MPQQGTKPSARPNNRDRDRNEENDEDEDDEEDDYDSEDSFLDDENPQGSLQEVLKSVFHYDKNKYQRPSSQGGRTRDDDIDDMEASYDQILKEERRRWGKTTTTTQDEQTKSKFLGLSRR